MFLNSFPCVYFEMLGNAQCSNQKVPTTESEPWLRFTSPQSNMRQNIQIVMTEANSILMNSFRSLGFYLGVELFNGNKLCVLFV